LSPTSGTIKRYIILISIIILKMYKGKLVKHSSSFSGNKKDNKILKVV